jgi:hypothetical protein
MEQALGIPILQTAITAHAILYEIIRYSVPIYHVADAFIRAETATDLPRDFTLYDLHWPMPGMVLGFPVQFRQEYLGRDVCYVFCADLESSVRWAILEPLSFILALGLGRGFSEPLDFGESGFMVFLLHSRVASRESVQAAF